MLLRVVLDSQILPGKPKLMSFAVFTVFHSCVYAIGSKTYDLTRVPVLSLTTDEYTYSASLCNPIIPCKGVNANICQEKITGMQFAIATAVRNVSGTEYSAEFDFTGEICRPTGQKRVTQLQGKRNFEINFSFC